MFGIRASRAPSLAFMVAIIACASPAVASGPEQIEQLEPEAGEWQAEASFVASRGAAIEPSFQLLRGLSDQVAIGVEVEGQWSGETLSLDGFAPTILYRLSDGEQGLGLGAVGQIEFAPDFTPVGAEARLGSNARRSAGGGRAMSSFTSTAKRASRPRRSAIAGGYEPGAG